MSPIHEYLLLDFPISRFLLKTSMSDGADLQILTAKVICYSLLIFSLFAAFEALVINGTKVCCNSAFLLYRNIHRFFVPSNLPGNSPAYSSIINQGNDLFFNPAAQPYAIQPPLSIEGENSPVVDEPLPLFSPEEEVMFSRLFEILASNLLYIAYHRSFLMKSKEETAHIHPLQVMGYMLEKNSRQREHCAIFFKTEMVREDFIKSTLKGFAKPIHAAKTLNYIVSFSEKVGVEPNVVHGYLSQDPPLLKELVNHVLQNSR